jgi:hypothetical protein
MNRILKSSGLLIFVVPSVIKDYTEKIEKTKETSYFKQKMIPITLYDKKIKLEFPSHTLTDWLSTYALKYFDLIKILKTTLPNTILRKMRKFHPLRYM